MNTIQYQYTIICLSSIYVGEDVAGDAGGKSFRDKLLQYCNSDRFLASRDSLVGSFIFNGSNAV